jgi:hypothetical protein
MSWDNDWIKSKDYPTGNYMEGLLKSEKGRWALNIDESKYKNLETSEEVLNEIQKINNELE